MYAQPQSRFTGGPARGSLSVTALVCLVSLAAAHCAGDNCLDALVRNSQSASSFCTSLLETAVTSIALPTYLDNCGTVSPIAKLSSACPCLLSISPTPATATVTVTEVITITAGVCPSSSTTSSWTTIKTCSSVSASSSSSSSSSTPACSVTSTVSAPPPPQTTAACNSILNGGFQYGSTAYWDPLDPVVAGVSASGGGNVELESVSSGGSDPYDWTVACLEAGKFYGLQQSFEICALGQGIIGLNALYRTAEATGSCWVRFGWYVPSTGQGGWNAYEGNVTDWKDVEVVIDYPHGPPVSVTVFFVGNCTTTSDDFYVDQLWITSFTT